MSTNLGFGVRIYRFRCLAWRGTCISSRCGVWLVCRVTLWWIVQGTNILIVLYTQMIYLPTGQKSHPSQTNAKNTMSSEPKIRTPSDFHKAQEEEQSTTASREASIPTTSDFSLSKPLSKHIAILPLTAETLPSYRRTFSILLPIRYPDSFYSLTLFDPAATTVSRVATWHDEFRPGQGKSLTNHNVSLLQQSISDLKHETTIVIGGIQCLIQPIPSPVSSLAKYQLYIQALALLSPYRGLGIATHLLHAVIGEALTRCGDIRRVYAHVWEANEDGLKWYRQMGFDVCEELVEQYYRKLKPSGAWIVQRNIGARDWLRAQKVNDGTIVPK